ncbi:hypothetical protein BDN72DRAFT_866127, partial [Pluteus cervinus]
MARAKSTKSTSTVKGVTLTELQAQLQAARDKEGTCLKKVEEIELKIKTNARGWSQKSKRTAQLALGKATSVVQKLEADVAGLLSEPSAGTNSDKPPASNTDASSFPVVLDAKASSPPSNASTLLANASSPPSSTFPAPSSNASLLSNTSPAPSSDANAFPLSNASSPPSSPPTLCDAHPIPVGIQGIQWTNTYSSGIL